MLKRQAFILFLLSFFIFSSFVVQDGGIFTSSNGEVKFVSQAPLETIKAASKKLSGALDTDKRTYAFSVAMTSFEGFNSPLQKEHFNENYMESAKLPTASFKGKIIEEVDLHAAGTYSVRAKGNMKIHGIEKEMIVKSTITVKVGQINVASSFKVSLKDFDIKIPNIINQKIAPEIAVEVKMDLSPKK